MPYRLNSMKGFYTTYRNIDRWTAEGTISRKYVRSTAERFVVEVLTNDTPFHIAMDFKSADRAVAYMETFYPKVKKESFDHFQAMVRNHDARRGQLDGIVGHDSNPV